MWLHSIRAKARVAEVCVLSVMLVCTLVQASRNECRVAALRCWCGPCTLAEIIAVWLHCVSAVWLHCVSAVLLHCVAGAAPALSQK